MSPSNVPPASPSKRQLAKLQEGRDRALLERQAEDRRRVQEYRAWLRNGMPGGAQLMCVPYQGTRRHGDE